MRRTHRSRLLVLSLSILIVGLPALGQINWEKHASNPVVPAWSGDTDDPSNIKHALGPTVMFIEEGLFQMWFATLTHGVGTSFSVSEAISLDGLDWYVKTRNPVLRRGQPGAFDSWYIRKTYILADHAEYKLYYSGYNYQRGEIGLATSSDRKSWMKHSSNPVLTIGPPGSWESSKVRNPSVLFDEGIYKMWYDGSSGGTHAIGYATSPDGINWTKYPGNPVISRGTSGSFDATGAGEPTVAKVGATYHLIYTGYDEHNTGRIGYAYSMDGIIWHKYSGNPVLNLGTPGSWDDSYVASGSLLFLNDTFHLWYVGKRSSGDSWQIGYATSGSTVLGLYAADDPYPTSFNVKQNYPNPFNPSTQLSLDFPSHGRATVKIFDISGREVAVLFESTVRPGTYSIHWDGKNIGGEDVSSGTYFARIHFESAYGSNESKSVKLLLVR